MLGSKRTIVAVVSRQSVLAIIVVALCLTIQPSYAGTFLDDFNDGNADGWWLGFSHHTPPLPGNWRVENGTLIQDLGGGRDHFISVVENLTLSSQSLETKIKIPFFAGYGGVVLWYVNQYNFVNIFFYPAFYELRVMECIDNSCEADIGSYTAYPYNMQYSDTWYTLRVDANSITGALDVYVNDIYQFTYNVRTVRRSGKSGVHCGNGGAHFDDFTVSYDSALWNRGGGLIYNEGQNITWLQDANYAMTSGYDPDGAMPYRQALKWVNNLVYAGFTDWRLPFAGSPPLWFQAEQRSEMGHLFYIELGNVENYTTFNPGPFTNLYMGHWARALPRETPDGRAFYFAWSYGWQDADFLYSHGIPWPVRDGDVGFAPNSIDIEPGDTGNIVDLRAMKVISVAILSTSNFSAPTQVNKKTLTFGATGNERSLASCARSDVDVNSDGLNDLVCTFTTKSTAFKCGDTAGILKGKTVAGRAFELNQGVTISHCQ